MAIYVTSSQLNSTLTLPSPSPSSTSHLFHSTFRNCEFRSWRKKRRFKRIYASFEHLSIVSPVNWLPPAAALGFASAFAAISILNKKHKNHPQLDPISNPRVSELSEWILFTTPTPFNRFVLLRCPSIIFESGGGGGGGGGGGEVLEGVSERLVKEEKHYVRLDSVRSGGTSKAAEEEEEMIEYQRVCVVTNDGGVISLDWPSSLELSEECGLDTTVLLIPGTAKGSMGDNVRCFVRECLRGGLFPVVMNPRGCAGSALTTARLFTAADSDDIGSAIQFITKVRPRSTLTGVGWGYGANMLTKYLAEAGEKTPLTAATCIDNPFDLDEATRTSPYCNTMDNKLTEGLIDILKSNKELFHGRGKGFDVEKALSAKSVRDFERAVSMVSYGFDTVEEFYSNSSTRKLVRNLKVPVLFVQNDNETVPPFSIPRGPIAENPFTSLLLCSSLSSNVTSISWYQQVAIEWLSAVELGLLKGRHPLLQDIDVSIKPSKGLALIEGRPSDTNGSFDHILNVSKLGRSDAYMDPMKEMLTETDALASTSTITHSKLNQNSTGRQAIETNGAFPPGSSRDESTKDIEVSPVESDSGEVLSTAQVAMNMLDVTMPGALKEEDKKKVLSAVGQGETLLKALQDAVPEDVRGKLTTSLSEIVQDRGKNLNLDTLLSVNYKADASSEQKADTSSGLKSMNKEDTDLRSDSQTENIDKPSDIKDFGKSKTDNSNKDQVNVDKAGEEDTDTQFPKTSVSSDFPKPKAVGSHDDDTALTEGITDPQNSNEKPDSDLSAKKVSQLSESGGDVSENVAKLNSSSQSADGTNSEAGVMSSIGPQDDETNQTESSISGGVGEPKDLTDEQSETSSSPDSIPSDTNEVTSPISDSQTSEKGGDDDSETKDENLQPSPDQNGASDSKSPMFSVSQAFDALTGIDDSTQVAVNSVFGVIEDMITHLEEKSDESTVNEGNENKDAVIGSVIEKDCSSSELQLEKQSDGGGNEYANPMGMESVNGYDCNSSMNHSSTTAAGKEKNDEMLNLIVNKPATSNTDRVANISKDSLKSDPYVKGLYKEYLRRKVNSVNMDSTTVPSLGYVPKDVVLLKQPGGIHVAVFDKKDRKDNSKIPRKENVMNNVIEPSYVIFDKERKEEPAEELILNLNNKNVKHNNLDWSKFFVKTTLIDSLKVEVSRRLNATDMEEIDAALAVDMERVADAIYMAILHDGEHNQKLLFSGSDCDFQEWSRLNGDSILEVISEAVQDTSYLKKVLPIGVIVGSTLAALRYCSSTAGDLDMDMDLDHMNVLTSEDQHQQEDVIQLPTDGINHDLAPEKNLSKDEGSSALAASDENDKETDKFEGLNGDSLMVGAFTAALGASAFLSQQEDFMENDGCESEGNHLKNESVKTEEMVDDKDQSNIVTSFAEKAISVAAPVVPTTEDGAVDQERIVAMLVGVSQKGGALRLVGKLALLWGGLRSAMSLTDRLFSFLRIANQPLLLRVLGFACMVVVLWSPVLVPLLPTLFQNLVMHTSSRIVELACIVGLYTAVTILIMQWGKAIRGYEYPFKQYGLDFSSPKKVQHFLIGLVGGVLLVVSIHSLNAYLGFINLSFPSNLGSSSSNLSAKIAQLFLSAGQGLVVAVGVAFVEELLFRSWLLEEIAIDFGYHPGIFLSGLAFAVSQRSWQAIPGLWLLSICLAGARLRKEGSLFIPIGLRTGLISSSCILQTGGFVIYTPKSPWWIVGTHPFEPFSGVVGFLFALLLAVALYPRQPGLKERQSGLRERPPALREIIPGSIQA